MNTFAKAIRAGLNEARRANSNISEILESISELAKAMKEATNGEIIVDLMSKISDQNKQPGIGLHSSLNLQNNLGLLGWAASTLKEADDFTEPKSIVLVHVRDGRKASIADIENSLSGFPCTIIYGRRRISCHDKQSLNLALTELMASPSTGRAILKLEAN